MDLLTDADMADCRDLQQAAMPDQCRINQRPTKTFDRNLKREIAIEGPQIYPDPNRPDQVGHCRVLVMGGQSFRAESAGEQTVTTRPLAVAVPWAVADVDPDCVVTIITSQADPRLNGRKVTVTGVEVSSYATARRLICLDNLG